MDTPQFGLTEGLGAEGLRGFNRFDRLGGSTMSTHLTPDQDLLTCCEFRRPKKKKTLFIYFVKHVDRGTTCICMRGAY